MTDFEILILGFFMGCIFSFVMIGGGVWFDQRVCKRKPGNDNDCNCDRCGNDRMDRSDSVYDRNMEGEQE